MNTNCKKLEKCQNSVADILLKKISLRCGNILTISNMITQTSIEMGASGWRVRDKIYEYDFQIDKIY